MSSTAETPIQPALLRRPEVQRITSLRPSTLYDLIKAGEFPRPVRLSRQSVAWRRVDIDAWVESLAETRPSPPTAPSGPRPHPPEWWALAHEAHWAGARKHVLQDEDQKTWIERRCRWHWLWLVLNAMVRGLAVFLSAG